MMPQRHRRWRYGQQARARPARESAPALTTNQVSYGTPPSQGGERTRVPCIPGCLPGVTGVLRRHKWSTLDGCGASPAPAPHGRTCDRSSSLCRGRYEDTEMFRGRRKQPSCFLHSSWTWRVHLKKCVVQPRWGTCMCHHVRTRCRWPTMLASTRRKKKQKTAHRISLSLDNRGPHKC